MASVKSDRLRRPSTSAGTLPSGVTSGAGSYSSWISPMSSSMRSSSVTMPAVPPYSSATTARCRPSRRISDSAASTRIEPGSRLISRATSPTVSVSSSRRLSRSRRCTKPTTSSGEPSVTGNRECRPVPTRRAASAIVWSAGRNSTSGRGTITSRICLVPVVITSWMIFLSSTGRAVLAATRSRSSAPVMPSRPVPAPSMRVTIRVAASAPRTTTVAKVRAKGPVVAPGASVGAGHTGRRSGMVRV